MIFKIAGTKPKEEIFIARKNDDKTYTPLEKNAVGGRIIKAEIKDFEYDGTPSKALDIQFEYKEQLHILNCGRSKVALSIANCIAGATLEQLENFHISVYTNKKTGYNSVTCRDMRNSDKIPWKLSVEDMGPLVEKTTKKDGTVIKDDTDLINTFQSLLKEVNFATRLGSSNLMENALDFMDTPSSNSKDSDIDDLTSMFNDAPEPAPTKKKEDDGEIHIDDIPF